VLAVALILKNLDRYGFDDTHLDGPVAFADLAVPSGTELGVVARASGTSLQFLRQINPEMLRDVVPDRGSRFMVHIPPNATMRASALLTHLLNQRDRDGRDRDAPADFDWGTEEAPPERRTAARRPLDIDEDEVPARTRRGRAHASIDDEADSADALPAWSRRRASREDDLGVDRDVILYRVGDNETVLSIARSFNVRADDIIDDNHLDPASRLQRGMVLKLRPPPSAMQRIENKRAQARLDRQDEEDSGSRVREPEFRAAQQDDEPSASRAVRRRDRNRDDDNRSASLDFGDLRAANDAGVGASRQRAADETEMLDAFAIALSEPRHKRATVHLNRLRPTHPESGLHPRRTTKRVDDP